MSCGLIVPTAGTIRLNGYDVKDWITHLAADEGKTVVLTTHQLGVAQELSDRIAVIRDGAVIADLPTSELLSRYAEDRFEVRVAGLLEGFADALPAGARAEADGGNTRVILGDADAGRLHCFLDELHAKNMRLLSVTQGQPDLEEIFLRLIHAGAGRPRRVHRHSGCLAPDTVPRLRKVRDSRSGAILPGAGRAGRYGPGYRLAAS
jgi:ABC-2 type transport system ATP-binding protein